MPDNDYTAVLFILDRSGSMGGIARTVEDSMRQLAREQAAAPGKCTIDLVTFNTEVVHAATMVDAKDFRFELSPGGGTALYDGVVVGITKLRTAIDKLPKNKQPKYVQVVVVTDGEENSSKVADVVLVRDTIAWHADNLGWDISFLGSNQDAVIAGAALGIEGKKSMTFSSTASGVQGAATSLNDYIAQTRSGKDAGFSDENRKASV